MDRLPGPGWLRRRRASAFEELATMPLPSEKEEVWRYSPIDRLDLDSYRPTADLPEPPGMPASARSFIDTLGRDLPERGALVTVVNGRTVSIERPGLADPVLLGGLDGASDGVLGDVLTGGDALVRLNDAFCADAVVLDVPDGARVGSPVVIVHWCDGSAASEPAPASFPRTVVRVGRRASVSVLEVVAGAADGVRALVVPVTELSVDDGGDLAFVSLQVLGRDAWHLGRLAGRAGRDGRFRTFTVGLGGAYDRSRTDGALVGTGGSSELRSAYLGTGEQIHDVRTLQDHVAARTTSDLLCKGAVAGRSRSIYSGLIRMRHGAVRSEAMQTNNNLVLDERAHADSVPNLDIEENDVRCSHASTVGPIDEDQRYYLESRGVPPDRAERLIVLGFFDDIIERSPVPEVTARLRREVTQRLLGPLAESLGEGQRAPGG